MLLLHEVFFYELPNDFGVDFLYPEPLYIAKAQSNIRLSLNGLINRIFKKKMYVAHCGSPSGGVGGGCSGCW